MKLYWRTGRPGQFVNRVVDFAAGVSEVIPHDWNIEIRVGSSQNGATRPAVDDPVFDGNPQRFVQYFRLTDGGNLAQVKDVRVTVRGLPCDDFHARRQRAAFMNPVNIHDRTVIVNTAAPVRYSIDSIAISGSTATVTMAGPMGANDFLNYQAVQISGCANAANNGRFRIFSRTAGSRILRITGSAMVPEGAGGVAVAGSSGIAQLGVKPIGTVTEYLAEAIGVNGAGDVASVAFVLPSGGTLFTLSTTGQVVRTKVGFDGVEALLP
jgi:hypothetical protein